MKKPKGYDNSKAICNQFGLYGRSGYGETANALWNAYTLGRSETKDAECNCARIVNAIPYEDSVDFDAVIGWICPIHGYKEKTTR